ncbi:hypothetical protein FQV39_20770 [Bosea sp. F3-2]|uniref:hypothetical protein n=1 Tax=Bosea sp. F3-2 TaxID=2599640 RepID=UPI0011ECE9F4|nr:hypothetical protein [Bosea sp. F3-2]QEL24749.1 hypothetical protein FQV39_20770 [Bosea sp. F3-2]
MSAIRLAVADDRPAIERIVDAAYSVYIERMRSIIHMMMLIHRSYHEVLQGVAMGVPKQVEAQNEEIHASGGFTQR